MRLRSVLATVSVMALALTTLGGIASAQTRGPVASIHGDAGERPAVTTKACKGGQNLGAPNGDSVSAQDLGPGWDPYDTYGAADFKLKKRCQIREIYVDGTSDGTATGIQITIYRNFGSLPDLQLPAQCTFPLAAGAGPDFTVDVSDSQCELKKARYWMVVQVQQDFDTQGQWFWTMTGNTVMVTDAWRNPGDGYGTGCTDFDTVDRCLGGPVPTEYMFQLRP